MSRSGDSLPVDLLCRINARCDAFEAACRDGHAANVADFLDGFHGAERSRLLRELIPLELDYRKQHGQTPNADELLTRFPELDSTWLAAAVTDEGADLTMAGAAATGIAQTDGQCSAEIAWQRLADAQLLATAELETLRTKLPSTAAELTARLVAEGKLTAFQARRLCAGNERPLVLGGYLILDRLGAGGMGTVYRALHRRMNREVALKLIKPASHESADHARWFLREAEAAAKLVHPNIVTAYDAGEDEGVAYLVTEFVGGMDLAALVRGNGPLPVAAAINYVVQAARGLSYAHTQGIIHRDVKPSNLLVDRDGKVRVLDVGLARLTRGPTADAAGGEPVAAEHSSLGALIGTVDYMAPEQAAAPTHVDERADIYGLGCTLYYLLTGRALYPGADVWAKLASHRDDAIPSLTKARSDVPPGLERLFQSLVAKRPEDRPLSMDDVIRRLKHVGKSRHGRAIGAIAAVLVIGIGLGIWWMSRPPTDVGTKSSTTQTVLATPPFDAAAYQKEWADRLRVPIEIQEQLGMTFMLIPPGRFSRDGGPFVTVAEPFYLGRTEVTVGQLRQYLQTTGRVTHVEKGRRVAWGLERAGWQLKSGSGYCWSNVGTLLPLTDEHPAYNTCWPDVVELAEWLTEQSQGQFRFRPPTQDEWEFACGAGSDGPWCCGHDRGQIGEFAWFQDNCKDRRFRPVAQKRPNGFGLYDMPGSLQEWCAGDGGLELCGGSFGSTADQLRSSARVPVTPTRPSGGIRLVREVAKTKSGQAE